jgi:hypothetical protein
LEQAEKEWDEEDEKLEKLAEDLEVLKGLGLTQRGSLLL